jgi:hypothetical protein
LLAELELLFLAVEDGQDVEVEELEAAGLLQFVSEGWTVMCIEA